MENFDDFLDYRDEAYNYLFDAKITRTPATDDDLARLFDKGIPPWDAAKRVAEALQSTTATVA